MAFARRISYCVIVINAATQHLLTPVSRHHRRSCWHRHRSCAGTAAPLGTTAAPPSLGTTAAPLGTITAPLGTAAAPVVAGGNVSPISRPADLRAAVTSKVLHVAQLIVLRAPMCAPCKLSTAI